MEFGVPRRSQRLGRDVRQNVMRLFQFDVEHCQQREATREKERQIVGIVEEGKPIASGTCYMKQAQLK